jgi:CRP-like cAMP-binding protein
MVAKTYDFELFEGLSDEDIRWLEEHSTIRHYDVGEYFARENDPADKFYIVLDGELQVTRSFDGDSRVMGTTPRHHGRGNPAAESNAADFDLAGDFAQHPDGL